MGGPQSIEPEPEAEQPDLEPKPNLYPRGPCGLGEIQCGCHVIPVVSR
jgi:hypothetical protein